MKSVIRALGFLAFSAMFAAGLANTRYFVDDERNGIIDRRFAGWGDIGKQLVSIPNAPLEAIVSNKLADGVFYLSGDAQHSVAIEQRDYVVLIEASLDNKKHLFALNEKIHELVPGKPVKYLINSHTCQKQVADSKSYTVVTFAMPSEVGKTYQETRRYASTSYPDDGLAIKSEAYSDTFILADNSRTIEFYKITNISDLALIYLPSQKILIETFASTLLTASSSSYCQIHLNAYKIATINNSSVMTPADLLSSIRQAIQ